jgi:hypothetical protein
MLLMQPKLGGISARGYSGQFVLLVCITYQWSIDNAWHETGQAYAMYFVINGTGQPSKIELVNDGFVLGNRVCVISPNTAADNYVT